MRRQSRSSRSNSGTRSPTWWSSLRSRDDWRVVDTETTGLGPGREVVEVAVVSPSGRVVFESRVRPSRSPEPGAVRLHGLDEEGLASAPDLSQILPSLLEHLEGNRLLAYNAPFDDLSLQLTARGRRLSLPPLHWDCLMARYVELRGFRVSLRTACEMEGLSLPRDSHRAAVDALLAWRLIQALTTTTT